MKLWLLERKGQPDWDEAAGQVIRAETPQRARELAGDGAGDEGRLIWLDEVWTTCSELIAEGPEKVILIDFLAG